MPAMPDFTIPKHPRYVAQTNGKILGPDPTGRSLTTPEMPMFWNEDEKRVDVILFEEEELFGRVQVVGRAYPAAILIASGLGAPDGFDPGFRDGDLTNLTRTNLIFPGDGRKATTRIYTCEICGRPFASQTWLTRHTNEAHSSAEDSEECTTTPTAIGT